MTRSSRQPVTLHRGPEGPQPDGAGGDLERAGDVRDVAVAELDQVVDGPLDAGRVVAGDGRDVQVLGLPVDHDHRHAAGRRLVQERVVEQGGGDDEAVDLAGLHRREVGGGAGGSLSVFAVRTV